MTPADWNTLAIMGTVASAAGLSMLWLSAQFRRLERLIYIEMDKHRRDDDVQFDDHGRRIQRLELKSFGFTNSGTQQPTKPL